MPAAILAALVLAVTPAAPSLSLAAGVPVLCVEDAAWSTQFPPSIGSAMGVYDTERREISLRRVVCDRLALLAAGARPTNVWRQYDFASAVFLFAHEIAHSRGIDDEAAADCAGGRSYLRTAAALGVGPGFRRVLASYLVNARIPARCYPDGN